MAQLITEDNLGAWLITCNPEANRELMQGVDRPGTAVLTRWCVADNYRSRMMKPGHRALVWVSGNGRRVARGIWGWGRVTGRVEVVGGASEASGSHVVSLDIRLVGRGDELSSVDLVQAGITDLEVQLSPAMSNPSWVTKDQLSRMETLLGPGGGPVRN